MIEFNDQGDVSIAKAAGFTAVLNREQLLSVFPTTGEEDEDEDDADEVCYQRDRISYSAAESIVTAIAALCETGKSVEETCELLGFDLRD